MPTIVMLLLGSLALGGEPSAPPPTRLYVRTVPPGAKVTLEGKLLGKSDAIFSVAPGAQTVLLELEGYLPEERRLDIAAEEVTRLVLQLKRRPAPAPSGKSVSKASPSEDALFEEVLKLLENARQQAKEGSLIGARATVQRARDLTAKLNDGGMSSARFLDRPKYQALHELVRAYVALKDFPTALNAAKEIGNDDRRREALRDVVMGAARTGETETAIRYLEDIQASKFASDRLSAVDERKIRDLVKAAKPDQGGESVSPEDAAFEEVLRLAEKAKQQGKEGNLIGARVTLEKAHALTAKLKSGDTTEDSSGERARHEIVRAYVALKDFGGGFVAAQSIKYLNRHYEACREVVEGALRAGDSEAATHYFNEFKARNQFAESQIRELAKLLDAAKSSQSDEDKEKIAHVVPSTTGTPAGRQRYTVYSEGNISLEYPSNWRPFSNQTVAAAKASATAELRKYGRAVVSLAMFISPNEEVAFFVSKVRANKPLTDSDILAERRKVYDDAFKAGDVTKINTIEKTTVGSLPAVVEDVERRNLGRGHTVKVLKGSFVIEISLIVNNKAHYAQYSAEFDRILSTLKIEE